MRQIAKVVVAASLLLLLTNCERVTLLSNHFSRKWPFYPDFMYFCVIFSGRPTYLSANLGFTTILLSVYLLFSSFSYPPARWTELNQNNMLGNKCDLKMCVRNLSQTGAPKPPVFYGFALAMALCRAALSGNAPLIATVSSLSCNFRFLSLMPWLYIK